MFKSFDFKTQAERTEERDAMQEVIEQGAKRVKVFLTEVAGRLCQEGLPIGDDCRINMQISDAYNAAEVKRDLGFVDKRERFWAQEKFGTDDLVEYRANQEKSDGERLERLKTAIFNKFLGGEFIVVRASRYDDIKNGVDNVIIDRQTHEVVCALDEVGDMNGRNFDDKKAKVLAKNKGGGVNLKYGLGLAPLRQENQSGLPLFLIALPSEKIQEGLRSFSADLAEPSLYERRLFSFWVSLLIAQVKSFLLDLSHPQGKAEIQAIQRIVRAVQRFEKTLNKFQWT